MKKLLCTIAALMITASAFGQGTVIFNNRLPANLGGDQRIYLGGGPDQLRGDALNASGLPGPGGAYTASLYLVNNGVLAATPVTSQVFRGPSAAAAFFITPVTVNVTGVAAGSPATFRVVGWETAAGSFDAAKASTTFAWGESNDITIAQLGGVPPAGPPIADPYLEGLQEFNVRVVPEPSTLTLGVLGAAALLLRRRK